MGEHPIKAIRRASVPLVALETADPAQSVRDCKNALNGQLDKIPMIAWDIVQGWYPLNTAGKAALKEYDPVAMQLPDSLNLLANTDCRLVIAFLHNAQRWLERDGVAQALWLLRDPWKSKGSTMILLGPSIKLPAELAADVIVVRDTSPTRDGIQGVVDSMVADAKKGGATIPDDYGRDRVVDGCLGLQSAFDVEQTVALNVRKDGIDVAGVWDRKIQRLRDQTSAEISIDNPAFDKLAGCANAKDELNGFIDGRQRPGVVLFMDEVDKAFGGAGTDLSGVSTNMLGQWLSWTQDNNVRGFLLAGIPGSGKTWTGKTAAGQAKVPFFKLSMADLKGSLVGESEQKLRTALSAVTSLAGDGSILMIASANWVDQLTPDVMGRFSMGTFFYDFPSDEEREALWKMYMAKFELKDKAPESKGWVGREIEVACWRAWQYRRKLADVAKNIAPSCIAQKARLDQLRKSCAGRFLSASHPGMFECMDEPKDTGRAMKF